MFSQKNISNSQKNGENLMNDFTSMLDNISKSVENNIASSPIAPIAPIAPIVEPNAMSNLVQAPSLIPNIDAISNPISGAYSSVFGNDKSLSSSSSKLLSSETTSNPLSDGLNNIFPSEPISEPIKQGSFFEGILTIFLLTICIFLIFVYGLQHFYGIDIIAKIKNIFTNHPEIEIKVSQEKQPERDDATDNDVAQIMRKPQVFNISDNNYIYSDAKAVCKAYGARLATYKEVEESYNKGGEWCNYGWSEDQMALFPTQENTWNELQKIEGHENDCGRPGINGGFIDNPKLKFGVNCYGYKPKINNIEKELMKNDNVYPKTKKDIAMDERVEYWKGKLNEIIVSPFNHDKWSKV